MIDQRSQPLDTHGIMQENAWSLTPAQRVMLQTLRRVLISTLKMIEEILKT
jgi:hypothetical protein